MYHKFIQNAAHYARTNGKARTLPTISSLESQPSTGGFTRTVCNLSSYIQTYYTNCWICKHIHQLPNTQTPPYKHTCRHTPTLNYNWNIIMLWVQKATYIFLVAQKWSWHMFHLLIPLSPLTKDVLLSLCWFFELIFSV